MDEHVRLRTRMYGRSLPASSARMYGRSLPASSALIQVTATSPSLRTQNVTVRAR
jgi:hypothetical protein